MGPFLIVALNPAIKIGLKVLDRGVDLLAKGDAIEFVEGRLVKALSNSVIRYVISWRLSVRLFPKGDGVMVSPSGTRGAGSTKVRAGRR